ncbi:MAG TPA: hypothetical protein ENO17_03415 [Candidatus Atribacteria bacterium]|nr:hypothetical protein [Candidatus Atribacteria bacterium]
MNGLVITAIWVITASFLGFCISAIFSNSIKLSRRVFLIPYVILISAFLFEFINISKFDLGALFSHNWLWGVISGVIIGLLLVKNVFSQPASRQSKGWNFVLDIVWIGLVYGIIDALFLNVMPVLVVWLSAPLIGGVTTWPGKIGIGALGLVASLLVTLAYHLGYAEFRNRRVGLVLFGNMLITLAFIISVNPLGAVLSHAAMHIVAVIRGPETTIQLPPHR